MMHFRPTQLAEPENVETLRALLTATLASSVDGLLVVGPNGGIISCSPQFAEMWRLPTNLMEAADATGIVAHLERLIRVPSRLTERLIRPPNGREDSVTEVVTLVDGRQLACRSSFQRVNGVAVGTVWSFRDVTSQVLAEQAREASERRYQQLFHESREAILLMAFDGTILDGNEAALEICGRTDEEMIASSFQDLCRERGAFELLAARVKDQGQVRDYEMKVRRPDGATRICLLSAACHSDKNGGVIGIQGHLQDVTERKRLEEQLRLWQRMEAIGRLAGGVAHDFNNLLTAVMGYGEHLKEQLAGTSLEHDVEEILRASRSAASLTRQLLAFSRQQVLQTRVLDLNDVVSGTRGLLRRLIGEHILLKFDMIEEPPFVRADPGQLEQVVINLVVNARDAMADGGTVTLRTETVDMEPHDVARLQPMPPGRYARLVIADSGHGMDDVVMSQIFEPFFTTKELGKGTGLGLATVYGIIKQSGGFIWVDSAPGKGTTFSVYLPVVDGPLSSDTVAAGERSPVRGNEAVLVVEDEPFVLAFIVRTLTQHGYHVTHAQNGVQALQSLERAGSIDLLVTDVVMPHMGGLELSREISRMRPGVRTLFMSGYSSGVDGFLSADPVHRSFLQKPFTPVRFLQSVRELLERPSAVRA